jgi:hypothetical protein
VVSATSSTPLAALQVRFCLINLGGQIRIADRVQIQDIMSGKKAGEVDFYKKPDGEILMRRHLETVPLPSDPKKTIPLFWVDPTTHVYNEIAFSPRATPSTTLNYWAGPTVPPKAGNWSQLKGFLREVICDNDPQTFEYLIQYLAHMLQKPEEKPGIIIVMLAEQGAGKGTLFRLLNKIWARTTLQVLDVEQVVGHFNAALERHYVICMDEAIFKGDNKNLERLKSLVTEPQCRIEQKYQPSRTIESFHRFFAASNSDHFAHLSKDDRRFLFLRVSSQKIANFPYFTRLHQQIESDTVVGAMIYDLLQLDIKNFNVRLRPKTKEHLSQKLQSLTGFDRFWYEVLLSGSLCGRESSLENKQWSTPRSVSTQDLTDNCKQYDKTVERYRTIQSQQVAASLEKLCPSAKKNRIKSWKTQARGYDLPHIDIARNEFNAAVGGGIDWDWDTPKSTSPTPVFPDWELEAMRETYDMDDDSVGPEDDEEL